MVLKKTTKEVSADVNKSNNNNKKKEEYVKDDPGIPSWKIRKSVANHWAILDEIEAPMWADLVLECDTKHDNKNDDDEWFHITHPFHQSSAQQLMSIVSDSAFKDTGSSSPRLPTSVSKSTRGNDQKKNRKQQEPIVVNKQHHLESSSRRSKFFITSVRFKEATEVSNTSDGKVNDHLSYKSDSVTKSSLTDTTATVFSGKKTRTKSVAYGGGEHSSTSTISSERKLTELSHQPLGLSSDYLSTLRASIRKSFVTRQASRGEIKGMRQSESRISYSSKSSVGSSMVTENIEKTLKSRTLSQVPTNIVKRANMKTQPAAKAQHVSCGSNLQIKGEAKKVMDHKTTSKSCTGARGIKHSRRNVDNGKDNRAGKIILDRKSSTIAREDKGVVQDPKLLKRRATQKSDMGKFVGPKENCTTGSNLINSTRMVERVYFR